MRGKLGPILSGIGGFLVVIGILLNVYAYPRLAVAPMDQDSISKLNGQGATVFDIPTVSEIETDLITTAKTVGDVEASEEAGDDIRIWVNSTSTKSTDGTVRARSVERVAFDAFTGEAVNCCGSYSEMEQGNAEEVQFKGQVFKFPFQTEQKDYLWWDGTIKRAVEAKYTRTEEVEGLETYVFVQTIEPEVWTQMNLPGTIVGETGPKSKEVRPIDRSYGNVRTFWVEPETGVVLKRAEEQSAHLQVDGENRVTLTSVNTAFSDETIQTNVDEYGPKSKQLKLIRSTLPLALGIGGLVLLVVGFLLHRRSRDTRA